METLLQWYVQNSLCGISGVGEGKGAAGLGGAIALRGLNAADS